MHGIYSWNNLPYVKLRFGHKFASPLKIVDETSAWWLEQSESESEENLFVVCVTFYVSAKKLKG